MKKKLLVFACIAVLLIVCTMAVGAADEDEGEKLWDFWNLLNSSNVDYIGVAVMLLTSLFTMFRMFLGNGGLKNLFSTLSEALKNFPLFGKS